MCIFLISVYIYMYIDIRIWVVSLRAPKNDNPYHGDPQKVSLLFGKPHMYTYEQTERGLGLRIWQ